MPSFKIKNMEKAWDRMPFFFKEDTNMAQINQPAKGTTPKCQQWKKQTNQKIFLRNWVVQIGVYCAFWLCKQSTRV